MSGSPLNADFARMTAAEQRDLQAAFERDKWAGEWNSLPTAIDRLLIARLAPIEALAERWERENRRPSGPEDQVAAGVWSATKADAAELRAVLRKSPVSERPDGAS